MTERIAGTIALLAVVLVGGYLIYQGLTDTSVKEKAPVVSQALPITWSFDPAGTGEADMPLTDVSVIWGGKSYSAGTHQGNCFAIAESAWELLPGEEAGAICWWAGAGTEIGVFREGGELVVKKGLLDEGTAEEAGVRGEFTDLFVLKQNADSVLVKTRIGMAGGGLGVTIEPLSILEDSRCPVDVACVQAGTVRVNARVTQGGRSVEGVFTLGIVETRERETITLVAVEPAQTEGKNLLPSDYRLTFGIEQRGE